MTSWQDDEALGRLEQSIDGWLAGFQAGNPVIAAVDRGEPADAERRWYVRMRGEEKEFITVWFTLGQRTLRYEAYVMPAPEENVAELYEQLLRRNERLVGAHFAIGVEDAIFLRGELPNSALDGGRARPDHRIPLRLRRAVVPGDDPPRFRQPLPPVQERTPDPDPARICRTAARCAHIACGPGMSTSDRGSRGSPPPDHLPLPVMTAADAPVTLAIFGGGNMGEALLSGLIDAGWCRPDELAVVEVLAPRRAQLAERYPGVVVGDAIGRCAGAVIAVKPQDVAPAIAAAVAAGARRVLSIAAGVTVAALEAAAADPGVAIVRAMPNTPALVRAGASAISPGRAAREDDLVWASSILEAVGTVTRVPETQLDAVTGLAGSGPAYVMLVAEALIEGGVLVGLPRPTARALVTQLLVGSAALLERTGEPPEVLRANVTSPGGTTAAGLRALEVHGVRAAFLDAVSAATERSRELGA